jgi:hypothetical protein
MQNDSNRIRNSRQLLLLQERVPKTAAFHLHVSEISAIRATARP